MDASERCSRPTIVRWLMTHLLAVAAAAGCAQVLGADFDGAHPRRPHDAIAGSDGGFGTGGRSGMGGRGRTDAGRRDAESVADAARSPTRRPDAGSHVSGTGGADPRSGGSTDAGSDASGHGPGDVDGGTDASAARRRRIAGVYAEHPLLNAGDPDVRSSLRALGSNGIHAYVPWSDAFYTSDDSCDPSVGRCSDPSCYGAGCPPCTDADHCYFRAASSDFCRTLGYDELECWVRGALNWWQPPLSPASLSMSITIAVHSRGVNDWHVGPSHVSAFQAVPADVNSPVVTAAFRSFYDRIGRILDDPAYLPFVHDWIVSIGDQVNDHLCTDEAWSEYQKFYEVARAYAVDPARRPTIPLRIGANASFFGLACDGIWDLGMESFLPAAGRIRDLNASSDVLLLKYFPADVKHGSWALNPERVASDVAKMQTFRDSILPSRGRSPLLPIVLQEVGYPTDAMLHDQSTDARYSRFDSATYTSGEAAQRIFLQNLFGAIARADAFDGFFWWSVFDIPGVDSGFCDLWLQGNFHAQVPALNRLLCTSGLAPALADEPRPAWETFRTGVAPFTD